MAYPPLKIQNSDVPDPRLRPRSRAALFRVAPVRAWRDPDAGRALLLPTGIAGGGGAACAWALARRRRAQIWVAAWGWGRAFSAPPRGVATVGCCLLAGSGPVRLDSCSVGSVWSYGGLDLVRQAVGLRGVRWPPSASWSGAGAGPSPLSLCVAFLLCPRCVVCGCRLRRRCAVLLHPPFAFAVEVSVSENLRFNLSGSGNDNVFGHRALLRGIACETSSGGRRCL